MMKPLPSSQRQSTLTYQEEQVLQHTFLEIWEVGNESLSIHYYNTHHYQK